MTLRKILILLAIIDACLALQRCNSPADCQTNECCAIQHFVRYGLPYCQPLRQEGHWCAPIVQKPINDTVKLPNGIFIPYTNVYAPFCPCADNLNCNKLPTGDAICLRNVNGENPGIMIINEV